MKQRLLMLLVLSCALGCAAPRHVGRTPMVPPVAGEAPKADPSRDQRVLAAADVSPPVIPAPGRAAGEDGPVVFGVAPPTYRTVVHVVETPVYVESPSVAATTDTAYDGYPYYAPYDHYHYQRRGGYARYRSWRGPSFPIHTAVGAGLGAVIGHQSGRRHRGAWIGGSVGLLMDLGRWWR